MTDTGSLARPTRSRYVPLFLWLGLVALAVPLDGAVSRFFEAPALHKPVERWVSAFGFMGGWPVHLLALAIVAAYRGRGALMRYVGLILGSTLVCDAIKVTFGRSRPFLDVGPFVFHPFSYGGDETVSFPSGQATSAMALATLLGLYFPRGRWFFWLFGLACAAGRVGERDHFLSDALFGAGLGVACVLIGSKWLRVEEGKRD